MFTLHPSRVPGHCRPFYSNATPSLEPATSRIIRKSYSRKRDRKALGHDVDRGVGREALVCSLCTLLGCPAIAGPSTRMLLPVSNPRLLESSGNPTLEKGIGKHSTMTLCSHDPPILGGSWLYQLWTGAASCAVSVVSRGPSKLDDSLSCFVWASHPSFC